MMQIYNTKPYHIKMITISTHKNIHGFEEHQLTVQCNGVCKTVTLSESCDAAIKCGDNFLECDNDFLFQLFVVVNNGENKLQHNSFLFERKRDGSFVCDVKVDYFVTYEHDKIVVQLY